MRDTYSQNSICHLDDINKIGFSFGLATQACLLFKKSYLFKNFSIYENLVKASTEKDFLGSPAHDELSKFTEWYLHDAIVIVAAFENFFKSVLLRKDFIIHLVKDKDLQKIQKVRPLRVDEYKKIDSIIYDEDKRMNAFTKLSENTLTITAIINNSKYQSETDFPDDIKSVFKGFVATRNTIHFLMGTGMTFSKQTISSNKLLLDYFNNTIIAWQNNMTEEAKRDIRWKQSPL